MEEPEIRVKPQTGIGRDLYQLSVAELEHFITELEAEIARVRAEIQRKRDVRGAAEAMFRRPPGADQHSRCASARAAGPRSSGACLRATIASAHVCPACGTVHYHNPKVVVGSVCTLGDRLLLCRRAIEPRRGFWTIPAGYLELGESAEAGALREAWEEARARIELEGLLAVYSVAADRPGPAPLPRAPAARGRGGGARKPGGAAARLGRDPVGRISPSRPCAGSSSMPGACAVTGARWSRWAIPVRGSRRRSRARPACSD